MRLVISVTNAFAPPQNPYAKHVPHRSPFRLCTFPMRSQQPLVDQALQGWPSSLRRNRTFAGLSPRRVDGQFERLCASADQFSLRFGTYRRADTDIAFLVRR